MDSPTTVLYLHSSSDLYGSDLSLLRTVRGLDRRAYRPIVCLPYEGPLVHALEGEGIVVHVISLGVLRRRLFSPVGILCVVLETIWALVRIYRIIQRERVRLIHTNTTAVLVGCLLARVIPCPHVWHVREIVLKPTIVRKFVSWSLASWATMIVCVSEAVLRHLERDQPRVKEKAVVLPNGIVASDFRGGNRWGVRRALGIATEDILVGMIGRVGSWKGQELFLEVASIVAREIPSARFIAVGSAFLGQEDRMKSFRSMVKSAGLGDSFLVEDFRSDVKDLLAAFDVFVMPSILPDPFPTTVLEAMAAACPIVANASGGVVEMLEDGVSGRLVHPNDAKVMATAIRELIADPSKRQAMGEAAQVHVEKNFGFDCYRDRLAAIYKMVLAGGKSKRGAQSR